MNSGWGINRRTFAKQKYSKASLMHKTDKTEATSPDSKGLKSHKSFAKMRIYNDPVQSKFIIFYYIANKADLHPQNEIEENLMEDSENGSWIGGDEL
jgi:hypothetical protein